MFWRRKKRSATEKGFSSRGVWTWARKDWVAGVEGPLIIQMKRAAWAGSRRWRSSWSAMAACASPERSQRTASKRPCWRAAAASWG
jgi:hypothetical protein